MTVETTNAILLLAVIYGLLMVHFLVRGKLPWSKERKFEDPRTYKRDEREIRLRSNQHLRVIKDYMKN